MLGAMCYRNKIVVISKNFCTETTNFKNLDISDSKTNIYVYMYTYLKKAWKTQYDIRISMT